MGHHSVSRESCERLRVAANLVNKDVSRVFDSEAIQSPAQGPAVVGVVPRVEHGLAWL